MPITIRKAQISSFGDISKISIVTSELPDPKARHVQVKVIYDGFSGADINMRMGTYPLQRKAPLTPGYCFVGTVHANGPGSTKFHPGNVVACLSVYDAEAEFVNIPEKYLVKVPDGINLQYATALILDWNSAYGMVKTAHVSAGQKVFIHGMSGAVGYALMQLCLMQGAKVYGTASQRKHEAIEQLGGTPFVYTDKDWIKGIKEIDGVQAVFDPLGFESWDESYSILSPTGGILVGYGGNSTMLDGRAPRSVVGSTIKLLSRNLWSRKHKTSVYFISRDQKTFEPFLQELFGMLKDGKISVRIRRIFDLENIQDAHRDWLKGDEMGSVLVKVGEEPL
jgi:synaptic vesicle membrane protein VAT-1